MQEVLTHEDGEHGLREHFHLAKSRCEDTAENGGGNAGTRLTMHRAKGTEFAKVLLLGVSENKVPTAAARRNPVPEERAEALLRERALLHVAAGRARDELVISYSGAPSLLLP